MLVQFILLFMSENHQNNGFSVFGLSLCTVRDVKTVILVVKTVILVIKP